MRLAPSEPFKDRAAIIRESVDVVKPYAVGRERLDAGLGAGAATDEM
jgi:hypothetical protein